MPASTSVDYRIIPPPADLARHVKFFWSLRSLPNNGDHYIFRTMASGYPLIFFNTQGNLREAHTDGHRGPVIRSGIYGPTKKTRRFRLSGNFGLFGACLFPFSTQSLPGVQPIEIANEVVSLRSQEMEDKMHSATCDRQRSNVLADFLRRKLSIHDPQRIDHAISGVIKSNGNVDITSLADEHFYSRRVFERKFRESTGFSPRSYSNVIRFQSSFHELTSQSSSLTAIAYQCGYYDQSHFTNEFTRLSGFNPKQFTTPVPSKDPLWLDFVAFFQFLSWCPPVLCGTNK